MTITDARAHTSATAGSNDPGWMDLTPGIQPKQIDLLSAADTQCVLAHLGSVQQLQAGDHQQIRLMLLDNSQASSLPNGQNTCGSGAANCVVLAADNSIHPLLLSSEAQTGIKIPSGQIAGGKFTVPAGQTVDINIDFMACSSIVVQGNGQYQLEPVLHAGELSTTASSIKGVVVAADTNQPITGGKVIVALERSEGTCSGAGCVSTLPIDRIFMEVLPDAQGNFTFCPVPDGTYDVVAIATGVSGGNTVAYAATITTGVGPGTNIGTVKLIPQPTSLVNPSTAPGTIQGSVNTSPTALGEVVAVTPLQPFNGGTALYTVPLTVGASTVLSLTTQSGTASYNMSVPGMNPSVGVFNANGTTYTQDTTSAVNYLVDAVTASCSPTEGQTNQTTSNSNLTVVAGLQTNAATISLSGCQ